MTPEDVNALKSKLTTIVFLLAVIAGLLFLIATGVTTVSVEVG